MDNNQMQYNQSNIPEEYRPISMWGYFGYQLLFGIPCVGLIIMIVMAFGAKNVNVKNFARSFFCWFIIGLIFSVIIIALGGATGLMATYMD